MRTYLKAFLFLALTASIACAGANFAQAAETAPAASAGNGMMPPVGTFDNNAAYQALTPEKQAKYNEIVKSAEEAMLPLREKMMAKRLQLDTMASMPNMNEEAIAKAAAEVASLHTQMIKVHDMMADRLANELGISIQRGTCSDGYTPCPMHRGMPSPLPLLNFSTDGEAATGVHNRSKKTEKDTGKGKERDSPAFLKTAIASDYKKNDIVARQVRPPRSSRQSR